MLPHLVIAILVSSVASFDYCTISTQNTMCKFKPTSNGKACMKVILKGVPAADQLIIVNTHNKLRRQVAQGLEKRGAPGPQPSASNMREISWDNELALMAQTHAQQCVFGHDSNRNVARFKVGQNLAIQFSTQELKKPSWINMIQSWFDEVKDMNASHVSAFPTSPGKVIGHYTQLVWAESFKIGCGLVSYQDTAFQPTYPYKLYYVCNYGPAGNFLGQSVYQVGTAASKCPKLTKAKNGLCA